MAQETKDCVKPVDHSLGHALGAVAGTAMDQARDLAVAQLDRWVERLRERLELSTDDAAKPAASEPAASEPAASEADSSASGADSSEVSRIVKPLLIGALAGAAVAWLCAGRRTET